MSKTPLPSPETLRKLLRYEPLTGKLFWRVRGVEWFKDGYRSAKGNCANWNAANAGKEAFTADSIGYLCGRIFNVGHQAHRVIWAMETGAWPVDEIDHENHNRADNRFKNLKEASRVNNCRNMPLLSTNKSGSVGVIWNEKNKKWIAFIGVNKKKKHLGCFAKISDAIAARKAANIEYNFHENHGLNP